MSNEILEDKSWIKKNWKWLVPMLTMPLLALVLITSLISNGNIGDYATAFSDEKLYLEAIEKANKNQEVKNALGILQPVDNMAIVESTVTYSNSKQSVNYTVRVSGDKGKAKMDVSADKEGAEWHYRFIKVRIKDPKQEIVVLQ